MVCYIHKWVVSLEKFLASQCALLFALSQKAGSICSLHPWLGTTLVCPYCSFSETWQNLFFAPSAYSCTMALIITTFGQWNHDGKHVSDRANYTRNKNYLVVSLIIFVISLDFKKILVHSSEFCLLVHMSPMS